jgi:hypothetical protein
VKIYLYLMSKAVGSEFRNLYFWSHPFREGESAALVEKSELHFSRSSKDNVGVGFRRVVRLAAAVPVAPVGAVVEDLHGGIDRVRRKRKSVKGAEIT